MKQQLKVRDSIGEITVTFEEMRKYHGKDFLGGVALAFKVLELAFRELLEDKVPQRGKIRLVLGFNPPGVIDGFEYVTRAISQHRTIIDPNIGKGPVSVFGNYYFEVHYDNNKITMWLKDGLLPDNFLELAGKSLAGIATEDEMIQWKNYKRELGEIIMNKDPGEILEIGEVIRD